MATALPDGRLHLTPREARILRRAQRIADQLDAVAATITPPPAALTVVRDTQAAPQRPTKAPAWLQRLIVRRATRTRPQERAAFTIGLATGIVLALVFVAAVSEAAR